MIRQKLYIYKTHFQILNNQFVYTLILLIFTLKGFSQNFETGLLPELTFSYKLSETYTYVQKFESRFPSFNSKEEDFDVQFERFDFQNFLERKMGLFSKLAIGYQYRIRNGIADEHRAIQQFSWVDQLSSFRIGHRLRSDQTFSRIERPQFRIRYRAKIQLPLQGQQLDVGEYYLTFSDEMVWSYLASQEELENRFVAKLGLYLNDRNKIEWGLDWRAESFFSNNTKHQLWLGLSWYRVL